MRIAEYKQIGTKPVTKECIITAVYDDEGNIVEPARVESYTEEVPVMGMVYRDSTPEEDAQAAAQQAEMERMEAMREPTFEEQMDARVLYLELMAGLLNEEE